MPIIASKDLSQQGAFDFLFRLLKKSYPYVFQATKDGTPQATTSSWVTLGNWDEDLNNRPKMFSFDSVGGELTVNELGLYRVSYRVYPDNGGGASHFYARLRKKVALIWGTVNEGNIGFYVPGSGSATMGSGQATFLLEIHPGEVLDVQVTDVGNAGQYSTDDAVLTVQCVRKGA